ncbi:MAG TPA: phage terminase large subunit, partial [Chloroflexota bacterium]|nr:phage terminase large subunit [Chloroflexota bacterium]
AQELREALDVPVEEFEVKGASKVARAEAVSPLAEGGKVWVPDPAKAGWVREWMQEMVGFPELRHDDRCDAAAMALQRLRGWREFIPPLSFVVPPAKSARERYWDRWRY